MFSAVISGAAGTLTFSGNGLPKQNGKNHGHWGKSFSGCRWHRSANFFHKSVGKCIAKKCNRSAGIVLTQDFTCLIRAPERLPTWVEKNISLRPEVYSDPCETSHMKLFARIVNGLKP